MKTSSSGRVYNLAKSEYMEMSGTKNADISEDDLLRLYNVTSDQDRNDVRVFLELEADGELLGSIVIKLRMDIVPKTCENFLFLCTGEQGLSFKGKVLKCIFMFVFDYLQKIFCVKVQYSTESFLASCVKAVTSRTMMELVLFLFMEKHSEMKILN